MIGLEDLFKMMVRTDASDAFIAAGSPLSIKIHGTIQGISEELLGPEETHRFAYALMNKAQQRELESTRESNFSIHPPSIGRFRISVFVQRGNISVVIRRINTRIPSIQELQLPPVLADIALQKRGLVIIVGGTGTGKTTTQAAMINQRNIQCQEHIITIEDPIEFVHPYKKSIISQREVGLDTESFSVALKNAMRQAPDVVQIGEIREAETMHNAIMFAETGHLCLATLQANNTSQALDRILSFHSDAHKPQLLMELSMNLYAVVAQRLIPTRNNQSRVPAVEIMISTPLIAETILRGDIPKITSVMERSNTGGLQTFDQSLYALYRDEKISLEEALRNAESRNNLRLKIKLEADAPEPQLANA